MPEYRIYLLDDRNKIAGPPEIVTCDNDQEAVQRASSHRHRSQRRHVHAAVSGLPEAAQVCPPSKRNRVDKPSG
jgi:hypothetical protein